MEDILKNKCFKFFKIEEWHQVKEKLFSIQLIMIKVIILIIDGDVSDDEWNEFYATFYTPFVACDADKDNFLSSASEMLTCLTKSLFLI